MDRSEFGVRPRGRAALEDGLGRLGMSLYSHDAEPSAASTTHLVHCRLPSGEPSGLPVFFLVRGDALASPAVAQRSRGVGFDAGIPGAPLRASMAKRFGRAQVDQIHIVRGDGRACGARQCHWGKRRRSGAPGWFWSLWGASRLGLWGPLPSVVRSRTPGPPGSRALCPGSQGRHERR